MISEESIKLNALFEVLHCFHASDLLQEIEVAIYINACSDKSMPMYTLNLNISVVFLELKVNGLVEINVRSLDCVHVLARHLELIKVEVLREDFHLIF